MGGLNIIETDIAKAIHENRFIVMKPDPHSDVQYTIYGDREFKSMTLIELIRIAYEAGRIFGNPRRHKRKSAKDYE